MLPTFTPPQKTSEEILAENTSARAQRIRSAMLNLIRCTAITRKECSDAYYGGGIAIANALFTASSDGGVSIVREDLAERQRMAELIADLNPTLQEIDSTTLNWATCSPLPSNMDVIPLDANNQPTDDLSLAVKITVILKPTTPPSTEP